MTGARGETRIWGFKSPCSHLSSTAGEQIARGVGFPNGSVRRARGQYYPPLPPVCSAPVPLVASLPVLPEKPHAGHVAVFVGRGLLQFSHKAGGVTQGRQRAVG